MKNRNSKLSLILLLLLAGIFHGTAQEMYLDQSFGKGGIVIDKTYDNAQFRSAVITDENEIIVLSDTYKFPTPEHTYMLTKYKEDGSRDLSFGTDGVVTSTFNTRYSWIYGELELIDGSLYVATPLGYMKDKFHITKYSLEGKPDSNFGTEGMATFKIEDAEQIQINDLYAHSKNEIYICGDVDFKDNSNYSILMKFDSTGQLHKNYGENGLLKYSHSKSTSTKILDRHENNMVQVMEFSDGSYIDLLICMLDNQGSKINSFAKNGCSEPVITKGHEIINKGLAIDNESIYLSGFSATDSIFILKYNSIGVLNKKFGAGGIMKIDLRDDMDIYARGTIYTDADLHLLDDLFICGSQNSKTIFTYKIPSTGNGFDTSCIENLDLDLPGSTEMYVLSKLDHSNRLIIGATIEKPTETDNKDEKILLYRVIIDN